MENSALQIIQNAGTVGITENKAKDQLKDSYNVSQELAKEVLNDLVAGGQTLKKDGYYMTRASADTIKAAVLAKISETQNGIGKDKIEKAIKASHGEEAEKLVKDLLKELVQSGAVSKGKGDKYSSNSSSSASQSDSTSSASQSDSSYRDQIKAKVKAVVLDGEDELDDIKKAIKKSFGGDAADLVQELLDELVDSNEIVRKKKGKKHYRYEKP